jgi:hypothetical protein
MSEEIDQEVVEQLRASYKAHGARDKVVKSSDGELVDGHQRKAAVAEWPEEVNVNLKTTEDIITYQIDKNWNRTTKSEGWKREKIGKLVELGHNVDWIIGQTGLSKSTVYRYMPQELKVPEKVAAGIVSGAGRSVPTSEHTVTTHDAPQRKECEYCHVSNGEAREWNGHVLCRRDYATALDDPAKYHNHFGRLKKGQEAVQEKLSKPQTSSQMSSWAHRSESMKVQHSQPEIDLMKELSALGITPETNQTVSLWWTIPDGLYRDKKVVYYVHGVVHDKGKALAKDDEIEAALLQLG